MQKTKQAAIKTRESLSEVFDILDKHHIPVTWAILGHVALDHCERAGIPHPEMPRPTYSWIRRDWYALDPCKSQNEEPAFYGKDIVDKIVSYTKRSAIPHDIGCHSFSHQIFEDSGCTEELAEAEVKQCLMVFEQTYGISPKVFVFPRDAPGHLDVLQRNGFVAFRGPIPRRIGYSETSVGLLSGLRKFVSLTSYLFSFYARMPPPTVVCSKQNGLLNVPGCMCYNKKSFIPLPLIVRKALQGIDKASKEGRIFHLYTHLDNFGEAPDTTALLKGFDEILSHADDLRQKDELEITTLKGLT